MFAWLYVHLAYFLLSALIASALCQRPLSIKSGTNGHSSSEQLATHPSKFTRGAVHTSANIDPTPNSAGGLYTNKLYGTTGLILAGSVLCGLSAGLFWAAEGAIVLGCEYSEHL